MNAYELADWVDEVNKPIVGSKTMKQVSAMLRQQADRIKELENQTITLEELRKTELYHNVRKNLLR